MRIAIIGNGISGVTAARFLRKLDATCSITLISAETDHFFSRTALMYIYMGHMRFEDTKPYEDWFWEKNRIELLNDYVTAVNTEAKELSLEKKGTFSYDKLILATGSIPNKFGWPGQDLNKVQGMYSFQDLESMEAHSTGLKQAVIVGGGLIGIEMAEMFHSRHIPVTMLVREQSYWDHILPPEESEMVNNEILSNGIDLQLETELKEIVDDGNGNACAVITSKDEKINCGFVGLTAGVHPNIDLLKDTPIECNRGILVDEYLQTSVANVYAIGDCAEVRAPQPGRRPIEAIWYAGRMMGETVAYTICGHPTVYDPGIWFNSAKFFDIEYQVYGDMPVELPEGIKTIYWEDDKERKSIRINYDASTEAVTGFNLMGVRYRHEVCEKWLADKTPIHEALENLGMANFDPEFYKEYEKEFVATYNKDAKTTVTLKKKRGLANVLSFLRKD